jgi:hypothetical protein
MVRRTFEQKWEELRRDGKLQDMIAEAKRVYEHASTRVSREEADEFTRWSTRSTSTTAPHHLTLATQAIYYAAGDSRFAQEVLRRSRAAMKVNAQTKAVDPNSGLNEEDSDGDDLEVTLAADAEGSGTVNDDADEIDYPTAPSASTHIPTDNILDENIPWADQPEKRCGLCLRDDTVDNDTKNKEYTGIRPLRKHLHSTFHSGLARFQRLITNAYNTKPSLGYHCPYCITVYKEAHPDYDEFAEEDLLGQATRGYVGLRGVVQHVQDSTEETTSSRHEELKELDGWNDEDFSEATAEDARPPDLRARTRRRLR